MIKWKFIPKSDNNDFDCYQAEHGLHFISLYEIGNNNYSIKWFRGAILTIQQSFVAANWDSAKNFATLLVKNYLREQAEYWRDLKISFTNWCMEDD